MDRYRCRWRGRGRRDATNVGATSLLVPGAWEVEHAAAAVQAVAPPLAEGTAQWRLCGVTSEGGVMERTRRYRLPDAICSRCGAVLGRVRHAEGGPIPYGPQPGDRSLCSQCGHVTVLGPDLRLRELSEAERAALESDAQIMAIRRGIWERGA